jgi:rhamnulokinase
VDYVLMKGNKPVLKYPYHYRDGRTDGALEKAFAVVPAEVICAETGIQFMSINTLYQLLSDLQAEDGRLSKADRFLNIGDYFNFLFSGVPKAEESLASTTQMYNPVHHAWSKLLMKRFGLPEGILPEVVHSGTTLGPMCNSVATECGLQNVQVIAGCSHDTGAAVAAVPAEGGNWAYLSSGTWSLLGIECARPIMSARSREFNFTNEIGYGGSIRFLKNISGLWIVQECRRTWTAEGRKYTYDELTQMAEESSPLRSLINPMDERFAKPGQMPQKISDYCRETNQQMPSTPGQYVRCVFESLALLYGKTLLNLEEVSGQKISVLHIVGGGSRNALLNQFSANATRRAVLAGPVECTAAGNVLVQAIALGHIPSIEAARRVVRNSFPLKRFEPRETSLWEEASARVQKMENRT